MNLADWQRSGWLTPRRASREAIADLFALADQYLADCAVTGLSADTRFTVAYTAALSAAAAALGAAGYRVEHEAHHYRLIQSLELTIGVPPEVIRQFEAFRKKRNTAGYERPGGISEREAEEMAHLARRLRQDAAQWIGANHPELL